MSLPRSPSQFELARKALAIRAPPNNENWSSHSVGARSPNSPYSPPVFNRLGSYASMGKAVPSFRKSRKNRKNRRANRKASRKNRKASRKNRN